MDLKTKICLVIIKSVIYIYDIVTFVIYFIVQRPWERWMADRKIFAKRIRENDPHSPYVRLSRNGINPMESIKTMDELFRMAVVRYGTKPCLGKREVLSEAEEYLKNGKVFKKVRLEDNYEWFSYVEIDERIDNLCRALLELGLEPKKEIIIFAETRIEWMLTAQSCFRLNVPVATLYATLGDEAIIHGINETKVNYLFTSQELLVKLKKIIDKIPHVTHIIYMENIRPVDLHGFPDRVKLISFSELEKIGRTCDPTISKPDPPEPNDIAVLMYTSGSTGTPKGVMISHRNMVVTASGLFDAIPNLKSDDVYIAYLPLAHAYEISAECFFFVCGIPVGYSSPYTLTDKSTGIFACKGDTQILQPTIMCVVPLMADRIRKAVMEASTKKGLLASEFFQFALEYKMFWYKKGFQTPILSRIIFKPIQAMMGGRLRILACGGAPLSIETHDFIRITLDCKMLQAYGMTETAGTGSVMTVNDFSSGRVGACLKNCFIKIKDWPEGGYFANDQPNPRGEIVIGGDCVTRGYYNNEQLTNECFKEEDGVRWFYTGDIAEIYPNATIKIIDRKKDLVKLNHGEYISLGSIEAELKTSPLIDNICVVCSGNQEYLVALVVPNPDQLKKLAESCGFDKMTTSEISLEPSILSAFSTAIIKHGQKSKLTRHEIPTKIRLVSEEWLPDSGLVTAAFKLRRKCIEQYYHNFIDEMYQPNSNGTKSA